MPREEKRELAPELGVDSLGGMCQERVGFLSSFSIDDQDHLYLMFSYF